MTKGDYDTKKVYSDSPIEVAKAFEGAGNKLILSMKVDMVVMRHSRHLGLGITFNRLKKYTPLFSFETSICVSLGSFGVRAGK